VTAGDRAHRNSSSVFDAKDASDALAVRIRSLRKAKRLSVEALAVECAKAGYMELTANSIYSIENGRRKDGRRTRHVTVEELLAFSSVLDVSLLDLLSDGDNDASDDAGCGSEASEAVSRLAAAVEELSGDNVSVEQVLRARKLYRLLGVELDEAEDGSASRMLGGGLVAQLLAERDEQRDRAERAEADAAEAQAYIADPYNRDRIASAVSRACKQRDEAVEAANAEVEEYRADLKAAHDELVKLRTDFAEQLADAKEMALDKLVAAFAEGYDRCRGHIAGESQAARSIHMREYSNRLPWPPYQPAGGRAEQQ